MTGSYRHISTEVHLPERRQVERLAKQIEECRVTLEQLPGVNHTSEEQTAILQQLETIAARKR